MTSRKSITPSLLPPDIARLCRQIERWRRARRRSRAMPDPLWSQAAALARRHGISRISQIAKLHYYALKKRVESADREGAVGPQNGPTFVELPFPVSAPECILELEHPRGGRMRIQVKGAPIPDLAALSRSFWGMES